MYITIRAFRNYGEMVPAGLIVEPSQIRRFKDKVREGKIVAITEDNKQKYNDYVSRMLNVEFDVDAAEMYNGAHYSANDTDKVADTTNEVDDATNEVDEANKSDESDDANKSDESDEVTEEPKVVKVKAVAAVSKEA